MTTINTTTRSARRAARVAAVCLAGLASLAVAAPTTGQVAEAGGTQPLPAQATNSHPCPKRYWDYCQAAAARRRALEILYSNRTVAAGRNRPDLSRYARQPASHGGGGGSADASNPTGRFDHLDARGAGTIGLYGWTFDPDTPRTSIPVHVYVTRSNGVRTGHVLSAENSRPDLVAHYPAAGDRHGYDTVISGLPSGRTRVDVYGIDSSNRANDYSTIGTMWVDVP